MSKSLITILYLMLMISASSAGPVNSGAFSSALKSDWTRENMQSRSKTMSVSGNKQRHPAGRTGTRKPEEIIPDICIGCSNP